MPRLINIGYIRLADRAWSRFGKLLVFIAAIGPLLSLSANDYVWSGKAPFPANSLWTAAENWLPNGVPGAGDSATISGTTVKLDQAITISQLTINGVTLSGSSLTVLNNLQCAQSTLSCGGIKILGTIQVNPGNITPATYLACPLVIEGQALLNPHAALAYAASGVAITNNGRFSLAADSLLDFGQGVSNSLFINRGILAGSNCKIEGGGPGALLTNSPIGTIRAESGTFNIGFGPPLSSSGVFDALGLAILRITANNVYLHDGASVTGAGDVILTSQGNINYGTISVQGTLQLGEPSFGATLTNFGTINIASGGVLNWFGGAIQGNNADLLGVISVEPGAFLNLRGNNHYLLSNILTNYHEGSINWEDNNPFFLGYHAVIYNGGDFDVAGNGAMSLLGSGGGGYNTGSFVNQKFFTRTAGASPLGATSISLPFTADGGETICEAGALRFSKGGVLTNNAILRCSGGDIEFTSGTFSIGNANFLRSANNEGKFILNSGGTLAIVGELDVGDSFKEASFLHNGGLISVNPGATFFLWGATYTWTSGTINLPPRGEPFSIGLLSVLNVVGNGALSAHYLNGGLLQNNGIINFTTNTDGSYGNLIAGDNVKIDNFRTINFQTDTGFSDSSTQAHPVLINEANGLIVKSGRGGTSNIGFLLQNFGVVDAANGTLELAAYDDQASSGLDNLTLDGGTLKFDKPTRLLGHLHGNGKIIVSGTLTNAGKMEVDTVPLTGDSANEGELVLGDAPGQFIPYNFTQSASGRIVVPVQGTNAATLDFGRLTAQNNATLNGSLEVYLTNGFSAPMGTKLHFLACRGLSGTFSQVKLPPGIGLIYTNAFVSTNSGVFLVVTGALPAQALSPKISAGNFEFQFNTAPNQTYTIEFNDDLRTLNWTFWTNVLGAGSRMGISIPSSSSPRRFFRIVEP